MNGAVHLGITGTRKELVPRQTQWLEVTMGGLARDWAERGIGTGEGGSKIIYFHHGDCIGADAYAHHIAKALRWSVVIHPPQNDQYRAFCRGAWMIGEPKGFLERNRDMVREISLLLGVPHEPITPAKAKGYHGKGISGTAYTVMYALGLGKETRICPVEG